MAIATPAPTYITPPTYAARIGVKPAKVIGYIKAGELRAVDVSIKPGVGKPRYRLSPDAIAEFEAKRSNTATTQTTKTATPARRRATRRYL